MILTMHHKSHNNYQEFLDQELKNLEYQDIKLQFK